MQKFSQAASFREKKTSASPPHGAFKKNSIDKIRKILMYSRYLNSCVKQGDSRLVYTFLRFLVKKRNFSDHLY